MGAASRHIALTHDVHATLDTFLGLYERLVRAASATTAIPAETTLAA